MKLKRNLLALAVLFGTAWLRADVVLSPLFSDHAVLQAAEDVPVWGRAEPSEAIVVTLGKARASAVTDADGKWRASLDLRAVGPGPFELVVEGRNRIVATDVLVGQVWLSSGQSNMEWPLRGSGGAAAEIAKSENPRLRLFKVERIASPVPLDDVKGRWLVATPETTPDFSAISYYFGQKIQRELDVPVGLINAAWGGTPIEAWTRVDAYGGNPDLKAGAEKAQADAAVYRRFLADYGAWMEKQGRRDREPATPDRFNAYGPDAGGWKSVTLPGSPADAGLAKAGAVWISRRITLPAGAVGNGLQLWFGDVKSDVKVYWNGLRFGEGGIESTVHRYSLHGKHVTSTEGVLTARIFNPSGAPTVAPSEARFRLDYKGGGIQLAGEWRAQPEYAFPALTAGTEECPEKAPLPRADYEVASYLYNGMINPVIPTAIAGVIYNHGTSNSRRAWQYRHAFSLMITDWRKQWGRGDIPFYFCQLYNFQPQPEQPGESAWAEIREGQTAALALPDTGMAVLIDVGEAGNIHPADKRSPGERLARIALAKTYGKDVVASGPMFAASKTEAGRIRITFTGTEGGLVTKPVGHTVVRPESEVQGFAICGADRKWRWAQAKIEGDTVMVWSADVNAPVAVRYGWADNPVCNLYNGAGLPASPFRTDDFPLASQSKKY
ncbi:MAG: sialate O-acetylesterase [Opitutaceae bacterium]|jgi:sialate O-acetylesterase